MNQNTIDRIRNTVATGLANGWLSYPALDARRTEPGIITMVADMTDRATMLLANSEARLRRDAERATMARQAQQTKATTGQQGRKAGRSGGGGGPESPSKESFP